MRTKRLWLAIAVLPMLAACEHDLVDMGGHPASTFGEANRQTLAARLSIPIRNMNSSIRQPAPIMPPRRSRNTAPPGSRRCRPWSP